MNQSATLPVTAADDRAAAARIAGQVIDTPCLCPRTLSEVAGCEVHAKFENLRFTSIFQQRGALNRLLQLDEAPRTPCVIACPAGSHAQGVAFHVQRMGLPAVIVIPSITPMVKVERTQTCGAESWCRTHN